MKNICLAIIILFLCIPFGLDAKDNDILPASATNFLEIHFLNIQIAKYKNEDSGAKHEVILKSGHKIYFDRNGNWTTIDGEYIPIPKSVIDLLPVGITKYISNNYARKIIVSIKKIKIGYIIEIGNSDKLKFDFKGNFISRN